jgi:small subunit ribosomal protein S21
MIEIQVKDNSDEAFDRAVKLFKKVCNNDGFIQELRDRQYYKKPSEKKHEQKRTRRNEHAES